MKEKRLLYAIGWVEDRYIEEMNEHIRTAHFSRRKLWFLAAVIAMTLLLAGCVAAYLWMQELIVDQKTYTEQFDAYGHRVEPVEKIQDTLSFFAPRGTVKRKALEEWEAFLKVYDPEELLRPKDRQEDLSIPENFRYVYDCYTWDMVDKLTEIAGKYNLKLVEGGLISQQYSWETSLEVLGIDSFVREGVQVEYGAFGFYPPYNFVMNMNVTLTGSNTQWPYRTMVTLSYDHKEYLSGGNTVSVELDQYQQWEYTTPDGTHLRMALNQQNGQAYLLTEREDACILAIIRTKRSWTANNFQIEGVQQSKGLTREAVEELADALCFQFVPKAVDADALESRLAALREQEKAQNAELWQTEVYRDFADYLMQNFRHKDSFYTFLDLDGDGKKDMLLGDGTGRIFYYLTEQNGEVIAYAPPLPDARLLQNGGLMYGEEPTQFNANFRYWYYRPFGEGMVLHFEEDLTNVRTGGFAEGVEYREGEWLRPDMTTWPVSYTPITEAEGRSILEKYPERNLEWLPLTKYPVNAEGKTYGEFWKETEIILSKAERLALYRDRAHQDRVAYGCKYYVLRDINEDGMEELLLSENGAELFCIYTIRNGKLVLLSQRNLLYLCEGNIVEEIRSNFDNRKECQEVYRSYLRFEGNTREEVGFLYENVTEGTWSDNYDLRPVTETEARDIRESFPHVKLEMNPIQNWTG